MKGFFPVEALRESVATSERKNSVCSENNLGMCQAIFLTGGQ